MSTIPPPLSLNSAGKRKGPKNLPRLPQSAFEGPNSAISDKFPLAPSPSTIHPSQIVDAHVKLSDLAKWNTDASEDILKKSGGVVVVLGTGESIAEDTITSSSTKVLGVGLPFDLTGSSTSAPATMSVPTSLFTTIKEILPESYAQLRWAFSQGRPVDLDIQLPISEESDFERFQDMLTKALTEVTDVPPIILSGILPPSHDLALPIVKLINHASYLEYQSQMGALSLIPHTFIKFTPPKWSEPTPTGADEASEKQKREWKRRVQMFLGPAIEAFGYERILFGSSGTSESAVGAWYSIARESFAEINTEQEVMDAVFAGNALKVYGA